MRRKVALQGQNRLALFNPSEKTEAKSKMSVFPKTERGIRSRIKNLRAAMQKERRLYGAISDGRGSRYVIFWLHLLLDDHKEFATYLRWYEKNFDGDAGEPLHKLSAAVLLHRSGREEKAKLLLAELMLANLYLVSFLLGQKQDRFKIWHGSNYAEPEYARDVPAEIRNGLTQQDLEWIREAYDSIEFRRCRKQYIELRAQLESEEKPIRRGRILAQEDRLLEGFRDAAS